MVRDTYAEVKEIDTEIITANISKAGSDDIVKFYAIEEMAELTKELTKALRGKTDIDHIIEEVADVYYGLSMLRYIYDIPASTINYRVKSKEARARKHLGV